MQEKINKRRMLMLAVLTVITLLALWWVQPENRLKLDEGIFSADDLSSISRVELTTDSSTVKLAFDGGRWRVNDQYHADGDMIRVLFATLQQARPKRAVANQRRDSIFRELSSSGVKVSLYEGETLKKEFFAGGNAAKTLAMFADPASKTVYVMTIPGYRVYVSGILELDLNGWRDKFVFGFNWRNFKSLAVEFPGRPSESFNVSMMRDYFGIQGMPEADTAKLNTYLDDVSLLTVMEYLSEPKLSDSLRQVRPEVELRVTDVGNHTYSLRLYDPGDSREGYGLIQDIQPALIDARKIRALLKPKSFFRKK